MRNVAKKGNIGKHDAYALAFAMINEALSAKCPLQAIAIEESILTDRLWSTLNGGKESVSDKELEHLSLGGALKTWHPEAKTSERRRNPNRMLFDADMENLFPKLNAWRESRNRVLHSIAKSQQGKSPKIPAEEFREYAKETATVGLNLTKSVCNWTTKMIRRAKRKASTKI